jgi:hypothetical protein
MGFWKWYLGLKWFPHSISDDTKYCIKTVLLSFILTVLIFVSIILSVILSVSFTPYYLFITIPILITLIFYTVYWSNKTK